MKISAKNYFAATIITLSLMTMGLVAKAQDKPNLKDAFNTTASGTPISIVSGPSGAGYNKAVILESIAGQVITGIFSLLGIVFILFTIYGGFLYMNARGNEEQTKKALSIITQNIIGLMIILGAYALTYFIIKFFI